MENGKVDGVFQGFHAGPDREMTPRDTLADFGSGLSFSSGEAVDRFVKAGKLLCNPSGPYCSFCYCRVKTTAASMQTDGCGCVPIKLYKNKQRARFGL